MTKIYNDVKNEVEMLKLRKEYLLKEKEIVEKMIDEKSECLKKIEVYLKELSGIEEKLFYQVIVKGLNITKAVDKVSLDTGLDPSTIWKRYYPKVKEIIKKSSDFLV